MKIIDFELKGNVVRFALGADNCNDYWGDDWDDVPYEHNAGPVYDEFITGYATIYFSFSYEVMAPESDWHYRQNSPFCKKDFKDKKLLVLQLFKEVLILIVTKSIVILLTLFAMIQKSSTSEIKWSQENTDSQVQQLYGTINLMSNHLKN